MGSIPTRNLQQWLPPRGEVGFGGMESWAGEAGMGGGELA